MDINLQISPQYLTKNQITVTILDVVNPVHYVVRESPDLLKASSEANNFLEAEEAMQKYYASVQPCFFQLPLKDSVIVVLYKDKFYRAKVIRILTMSAGHLFRVYLVDYGMECSIPRDCIYEIERDFLIHPFQAVSIKLLGIEPISLIMNPADLTMSYGSVSYWDPSSEIYVHDLQKDMCNAYIEVKGIDDQHIYGRLYICYESIPTKCINDELVSNTFARFNEDCWKDVQKLESILENPTMKSESSAADESIISEKSNPEQMSNIPNCPEIESVFSDFKMMFIRPSDGKIVAESSLTKDTLKSQLTVEDSLQPQLAASSGKETVSECSDFGNKNLKSPPSVEEKTSKLEVQTKSVSSEVTSEEEMARLIAQKKFLRLQQLNRKKRRNHINSSSVDITSVKSVQTVADNKTDGRNSIAEVCTETTEKSSVELTSRNSEKNLSDNAMTASKLNISRDCDNSKSGNVTQQSNSSNLRVQASSEDSSKEENVSLDQFIAHKGLQHLKVSQKKLLSSPIHQTNADNTSTPNSPSSVENTINTESSADVSDKIGISLHELNANESKKNLCNRTVNQNEPNISGDSKTNSIPSCQSIVSNDAVPTMTEKNSETQNMTQAQLIARKKFLKLQQLNRKQLRSPMRASSIDPAVVKSLPTVAENAANEKDVSTNICSNKLENLLGGPTTIESEKSSSTLSKSDVSSRNPNVNNPGFQSCTSNDRGQEVSEGNSKQENSPGVILENVKTLQRLRNQIRLKRMKESLQASEQTSGSVKQIEETFKDKSSIDSPSNVIFTSSGQLQHDSSSPESQEEIMC